MNGLFVFDTTYENLPLEQDGFFNRENIPAHDTKADNYTHFVNTINVFEKEIQKHVPSADYQGFYVANNGVYFEPLPEEILHILSTLIFETATHNGLCVYDGLTDSLCTPAHKDSYPQGQANELWQTQRDDEAKRLKELDTQAYVLPKTGGEANKLIRKLVKERFAEAGIKAKKTSSMKYGVDLGEVQIELYMSMFYKMLALESSVHVESNVTKYLTTKSLYIYLFYNIMICTISLKTATIVPMVLIWITSSMKKIAKVLKLCAPKNSTKPFIMRLMCLLKFTSTAKV